MAWGDINCVCICIFQVNVWFLQNLDLYFDSRSVETSITHKLRFTLGCSWLCANLTLVLSYFFLPIKLLAAAGCVLTLLLYFCTFIYQINSNQLLAAAGAMLVCHAVLSFPWNPPVVQKSLMTKGPSCNIYLFLPPTVIFHQLWFSLVVNRVGRTNLVLLPRFKRPNWIPRVMHLTL